MICQYLSEDGNAMHYCGNMGYCYLNNVIAVIAIYILCTIYVLLTQPGLVLVQSC